MMRPFLVLTVCCGLTAGFIAGRFVAPRPAPESSWMTGSRTAPGDASDSLTLFGAMDVNREGRTEGNASERLVGMMHYGDEALTTLVELSGLYSAGKLAPDEAAFLVRAIGRRLSPASYRSFLQSGEYGRFTEKLRQSLLTGQAESFPDETIAHYKTTYGDDLGGMSRSSVNALFRGAFMHRSSGYDDLVEQLNEKHRPAVAARLAEALLRVHGYTEARRIIDGRLRDGDSLAARGRTQLDWQILNAGREPTIALAKIKAREPGLDPVAFAMAFGNRYPASALEWVAGIQNRPELVNGVASAVARDDPDLALDFAATYDSSRENKIGLLTGLMTAFRSNGQMDWVEQCDALLKELENHEPGPLPPPAR